MKGPIVCHRALEKASPRKPHGLARAGHPFDSLLLARSALYRRSRTLFLELGGTLRASFVSTPRTLGSAALLGTEIEYSALDRELSWLAREGAGRPAAARYLDLRSSVTSLFHEQNHRILWKLLPPCPRDADGQRRWLNFAESQVVVLDMALGDELGPELAQACYQVGVTYDPGTRVRQEGLRGRPYRNYLQAASLATWWALELYSPARIRKAIPALFPVIEPYALRAADRALRLDAKFIERTNPMWQLKHRKAVNRAFGTSRTRPDPLTFSEDPMDHRLQYLWTEKILDTMGV